MSPVERSLKILIGIMVFAFGGGSLSAIAQEEATPAASPVVPGDGWRVAEVRAFEIDGRPVALSPDGHWMAGRGPDNGFCVWEVETLASRCATQQVLPYPGSVRWAPDSSAVAFSRWRVEAKPGLDHNGILVFNVAARELRNLSDPGGTIVPDDPESTRLIDVYPAWSPDGGELIFARLNFAEETAAIMRIDRSGGAPESFPPGAPNLYGPMHWVAGDRVFYATTGPAEADNSIRVLNLDDGTSLELLDGGTTGEVRKPVLVDVSPDGSWFTVYAGRFARMRENDNVFGVVNSQTGEVQTFGFPSNPAHEPDLLTGPRFSPDGQWLAALVSDGSGTTSSSTLGLWKPDAGGPSTRIQLEHAYAPANTFPIGLPWAENDTVLLVRGPGSSGLICALLTVERDP